MRTLISSFLVLGLVCGCGKQPAEESAGTPGGDGASTRKTVHISVVLGATGNEFAGEQRAGVLAAARDLGTRVQVRIAGPAQIDPGEEVKIFENESATLPDALIVAPMPPSLFVEPARKATDQGIPVAYLMTPPSPEISHALFVGQRDYDVGRRAANLIADLIVKKTPSGKPQELTGTILLANCVPGMENLDDRMQGVREALLERLPALKIPPEMNSENERGSTFALWQQAVQANPNALAFIGACENDSVSLAKIKEDDHRGFAMVVFDTPEAVRNSIKQGTIAAAVPPSHFTSAYMAVWTVGNALLKGAEVPQGWLETSIRVIDKNNVDAFSGASLPPQNLESFYQKDIDLLKTKSMNDLPPLTAARAPAAH
jgi:ribose transport system substrate-binding protein